MVTPRRPSRSSAEWVTFACALAVLLVVVALVLLQIGGSDAPAAPLARIDGEVREADGTFYVTVLVHNDGDMTASNVQVQAELTIDDETATADQTIDFLPGDDLEDLVFAFDDDPAGGELVVRVTGFANP